MKWFKHDADAHADAKLERVRLKYGMEGYGLYWYCLELIARNVEVTNLTFELEHDAEVIALRTGIHYERVQEMMTFMVGLNLFEDSCGRISCLKMATRTDEYVQKSIRKLGNGSGAIRTLSGQTPDTIRTSSGHAPEKVRLKRTEQNRTEQNIKPPLAPPSGVGDEKPPSRRKPKSDLSAMPADFALTPDMRTKALRYWADHDRSDLNPDDEFVKFVAHHSARGSVFARWESVWTTWYANAVQLSPRLRVVHGGRSDSPDEPHWTTQGVIL